MTAKQVAQTAAVAVGTLVVLESLAMAGLFDWRTIPEKIGSALRPPPPVTADADE